MKILMTYVWSPYTTAAYLAKAFRELGHDVRSVGPVRDAGNVPERQWYRLGPGHWTEGWSGWEPDALVWVEAGGSWCPDVSGYDMPTIGWFIDSHSHLEEHKRRAGQFDRVFVAHKQFVDQIPGAEWLPVACDPDVHTPTKEVPRIYDVAFVGNAYGGSPLYAERRRLLGLLAERYVMRQAFGVYFEDMADVYASAKVVFNVSTGGDLNMRVFEAMCSGTPLVTDVVPGIDTMKPLLDNLVGYRDSAELFQAMEWLLTTELARDAIANMARAEVLAHHTYRHRAERMVEGI